MGCTPCQNKRRKYVVTDTSGECLIRQPNGECVTYDKVRFARNAAMAEGLETWRVEPVGA